MSQVPVWYERKFSFTFPPEQYPNLCSRLRGTPARLEEIVRSVAPENLVRKAGTQWSIQEHAGHLLNLEPLWRKRVGNFLEENTQSLAVTDLSNRQTDEANYNASPLADILAAFRASRQQLLDDLEKLEPESYSLTRLHPRLKQPMRLVDHLYFVAEHDDHHLAKIWELIKTGQ